MKIGFIGCGNMGGALAFAIGSTGAHEILLADTNTEKAEALAARIGAVVTDAEALASCADFLFLGVKPYGIRPLVASLSDALKGNTTRTLVSMAAGVRVEAIENALATKNPVIRILPNTPVAVGKGMTVYTPSARVGVETENAFVSLMTPTGAVDRIDESLIDAACAVAGCGPAFAYMFIDALAKGGERAGLSYDSAKRYAAEMVKGAAEMVLAQKKSPDTLREEVCSPGGSTIEGVRSLWNDNFSDTVSRAVNASYHRTVELGKPKE